MKYHFKWALVHKTDRYDHSINRNMNELSYEKNLFKCRLIPMEVVEIWNVSNVESRRRSTQITWKLNQINNIWQHFNLHNIEIKNIKHYQLPVFRCLGVSSMFHAHTNTQFIFIKATFSMTQSFTVKWIPKIMAINVAFLLLLSHTDSSTLLSDPCERIAFFFFLFSFSIFLSFRQINCLLCLKLHRVGMCVCVLTLGRLFISFSSFIE